MWPLLVVVLETRALPGVLRAKAGLWRWWGCGVWGGVGRRVRRAVVIIIMLQLATSLVSAPAAFAAHHTARLLAKQAPAE